MVKPHNKDEKHKRINRKKMVEYIWVMTNNFACQEEKENLIKNKLREKIMNITFIWFSGDD